VLLGWQAVQQCAAHSSNSETSVASLSSDSAPAAHSSGVTLIDIVHLPPASRSLSATCCLRARRRRRAMPHNCPQ
jgi:hypothetical protein